ncbi:K02A2.6-like, partial [Cordylochernes scorpioides]
MAQIQPPETFDFSTPNEWPKWRKRFERYLVVSGMKKKEEADKIDLFMYLMGDRADDIFRTFKFEKEEEATKIDSVLKAFDSHFCVRKNIIYERAKFNSRIQEDREPVDEFITSLYKLADSCEFEGLHEQLIRDRIVVGVRDKALSERMQLDSELTLEKAVKLVRQQEAVRQQQVDLQRPSTSQKVNQVTFNSKKQSPKQQQQPSRKKDKSAKTRSRCPKCGGFTHREGQACRAEGQKCNLCSKTGHFANCCPDKQAKTAEVKAVSELDEEIGFLLEVSAVEDSSNLDNDEDECRRRWAAEIQVNGKKVKFKLDSQADVTCVPLCLFKKIMGQQRLVESDINIRAAEFSELQTVGMFISTLRNGNYEIKEKIYVIRRLSEPLLSRRACELLNLARRIEVVATRINPIKEFPEVFEGLGQIGNPYEIKLKPGAKPYAVHTPRRVPIPLMEKLKTRLEELDKDDILAKIFEAQQEDTTLKAVVNYLEQGWPDKKKMSQALLPYWHVKDELGVQNGLLMRSCRLVIPASMKLEILDKLHAGHFGITKTRLRARETVWWPGISEEIAETVRKCSVCIQEAVSKHEPLIPTNFPTRPWQKIGMDLFKFENKWYLVVIDYYSRFPEMIQLDRLTANVVVRSCKSIFSRHGIPETVVSDNGTQFGAAREFANSARQYGFTHVTSSPRFPQSNGMAEAGVKIAKLILKKNQDPSLGLLEYRSTPLENGYSPAELLMGRKLRTTLPIAPENLNPRLVDSQTLKRKEGRRRKDMKSRYDRRCGATDMEELSEGDTVWITDMRTWGIVKKKASTPRSYMVDTPVGTLRRNRFHLRKGYAVQYPADPSTPTFSGEELVENEKTPVVDYPSNDSEDGQIRTRSGRIVKPALQAQNQETREALNQAFQAQNQETREALNEALHAQNQETREAFQAQHQELKESLGLKFKCLEDEISSVKGEMKEEISSVKEEMASLKERLAAVETGHPRTPVFQQENNNSGRPLVKVPTFDGQSSWTSFKTQFDVAAQANGWNVRDKASFLAAALRGPAVDVLQMIPEQLRLDFNALIDALESRYGEEHYQQLHVVKFKNRLQEKKESLQDLANDIRRLARLAFPTCPSETQDFMAQQQFIDAIGDPETQKFARLSSATTLQETLVQAMKHEAAQQASRGSYRLARQVKLDNPERKKGRFWTCRAHDHMSPTCPRKVKQRSATGCWKCGKNGHISKNCPDNSKDKPERKRGRCWICGALDHISLTCPRKVKQRSDTDCWSCGQYGHMRRNCPGNSETTTAPRKNHRRRNDNADALSRRPCVPQSGHCARAKERFCIRQVTVQESDEVEEKNWTGQAIRKAQREDRDLLPMINWKESGERPSWEDVARTVLKPKGGETHARERRKIRKRGRRTKKLLGVLQASCCLKRSDCCLPPTPVYFLEYSRRFYELLSPVLLLLSLTVLQL